MAKIDKHYGGEYYLKYKIQPSMIAEMNGLGPMEYSVIKRMHRWRVGGKGVEDLKKAQAEIQTLIDMLTEGHIKI